MVSALDPHTKATVRSHDHFRQPRTATFCVDAEGATSSARQSAHRLLSALQIVAEVKHYSVFQGLSHSC